MKIVIIVFLLLVLVSLGVALVRLVKNKGTPTERGDGTVRALTWRISLSIALFLLLLGAYWLGLIQPHM